MAGRRANILARTHISTAAVVTAIAIVAVIGAPKAVAKIANGDAGQAREEAALELASGSAGGAPKHPSCQAQRRKAAETARQLARSERILQRLQLSRGDERSIGLARRRIGQLTQRVRRELGRSNRACGIRIKMKPAKGTVDVPAAAIADVSGDPAGSQTVALEPGVKAPARGGILVVDASSSGPGILGRVTASKGLGNGGTRLSLEPAALDQAYSQFDLRFDGSLADLAGSALIAADDSGATTSAQAQTSASKLKLFTCKGPQVKKPDILVDLTHLRVNSDIIVERRQVFFMISGRPVIRLKFELEAGASCKLNEDVKVFIPIAGPVGIDLRPVLEFSAGADSKLDFAMEPRIAVGFARGDRYNEDYRTLDPKEPSLNLHGAFGVNAFAGGSIGVSVGGRFGVRGKFGPAITAQSTARPGQICGDVSGALRIGLEAYANVFIADLTFQLAQGDFLQRALFSKCIGNALDPKGGPGHGPGDGNSPKDDDGPPGSSSATAVTAGEGHTCAVLSGGGVDCWGWNDQGQLGSAGGAETCLYDLPCSVRPVAAEGIDDAMTVAANGRQSCALLATGAVECWGFNNLGQLGDGTAISRSTPEPVAGIADATAIAAGEDQTCALLEGGEVECWGWNATGALGNGGTTTSLTPVPVSGIIDATAITAGRAHSCALLAGGEVECWGSNYAGQLGTGTASGPESCGINGACSTTPVSVDGIGEAIAIGSGLEHTCALLAGGGIECWGDNTYGQLGDASTADTASPVPVSGVTDATAIDATAAQHTCALLEDGGIECWGWNAYGQLGDGTVADSSVPTTVSGIADATAITTGGYHSCAIQSGGEVDCWGNASYGQLGNGSTGGSLTPVPVIGIP